MVSMLSPGATVIAVPPSQLQLPEEPDLRTTDPVPFKTMVSNGTGSVVRKSGSSGNWSWDGGTAITVAPGESIDTIAKRYGVPASALMQANNIAAPATLHPGQHLVIP